MNRERTCDVLIIGAGLAGGMMARLLSLQQPDLRIIQLERKSEFDYWIGESTVEVFTDYAERVLQLGPYLMKHQVLKHGLRFFFDSAAHDLPVAELSETGRSRYPGAIPSYQLDRSTFDRDLVDINRRSGVEVLMNARMYGREGEDTSQFITIDRDRGHVVQTTDGAIHAKWVIDAAGRASPLSRMFKLTQKDPRHPVGSYWGRYRNIENLDFLGNDEWRRRVDHTQRFFSTNHFMYRGYWIWLIPVDDRTVSLGVSYNRETNPLSFRNGAEMTAWFRGHKALDQILGTQEELLDFLQFKDVARCATQQFSADRWFLTGMSGVVVDALYSQTGVFNSYSNRLIAELIKTDRSGDQARFDSQLKHFNIFMRMQYEVLAAGLKYQRLGSYDAFVGWRAATQSIYFNRHIPNGHTDLRAVIEEADAHGSSCRCTFESARQHWEDTSEGAAAHRHVDEYIAFLDARGRYLAQNRGHFCEATERFSLGDKMHDSVRDPAIEAEEDRLSYKSSFRYFVSRMAEIEGVPFHDEVFERVFDPDCSTRQTLGSVLEEMRRAPPSAPSSSRSPVKWLPKGPVDAETQRKHEWYCRMMGPEDVVPNARERSNLGKPR